MELTLWEVLALAAVQGVAEFLPISSSGHVVILAQLMAEGDSDKLDIVDLNVALHLGTLLSILVVYAGRIRRLLTHDRRLIGPLIVATIPAAVVGISLKLSDSTAILNNPLLAGICLVVTGIMLASTRWIAPPSGDESSIGYRTALLMGLAQSVAILPGISRSGATISCGLATGLTPSRAATFSFLMAVPAIAGAGLVETLSYAKAMSASSEPFEGTPLLYLAMGATVAFLVGIAALFWLLRWLEKGRFHWFAWWCIPIGIAVILWRSQ